MKNMRLILVSLILIVNFTTPILSDGDLEATSWPTAATMHQLLPINHKLKLIELGQVIRKSNYVTINTETSAKLGDGYRVRANYVTANLAASKLNNLTVIRYWADLQLPFSARGCMPVFYYANNPAVIRERELHLDQDDPWRIILFANPVESIDPEIRLGRNMVIGTFLGRSLPHEVEERILENGNMILENLAPHDGFMFLTGPTLFAGYLLIFDLLRRQSVELPVLANLILIERGHCDSGLIEVLSHGFSGHTIPLAPGSRLPRIVSDEEVAFPEHYGTHIDAPYHTADGTMTTETLPIDRNLVPCVKVTRLGGGELQVGIRDFEHWEEETGQEIPPNSFVFIDTGNSRRWTSPDDYMGRDPLTRKLNTVGIDIEATQWLIRKRRIYGLGIDAISTDGTPAGTKRPTHIALARSGLIGVENAGHLERLPSAAVSSEDPVRDGAGGTLTSWCLFVHFRIEMGTGSPVAIFAHIPEQHRHDQEMTTPEETRTSINIIDNNAPAGINIRNFSLLLPISITFLMLFY